MNNLELIHDEAPTPAIFLKLTQDYFGNRLGQLSRYRRRKSIIYLLMVGG